LSRKGFSPEWNAFPVLGDGTRQHVTFPVGRPGRASKQPVQGFAIRPGVTGPGNTDTVIQRTGSIPDGATGTIPLQLVELSLKSTSPVNIGGSFFDVFVDVNAIPPGPQNMPTGPPVYDTLSPSTGTTTIDTNGPTGGAFHSFFNVFADVILTAPGGDLSNPAQVVSHFTQSGFAESVSGTWYPPGPCVPNTGPGHTSATGFA
jgi:hypothetical protein